MDDIVWRLIAIPGIVVGMTAHELAHATMALALGDGTAKSSGRITLNPLRHIDPFGFLLIVVAGFGWAKPVTFDPANFRKPKRDEILVALAGPFSNIAVAAAFFALASALRPSAGDFPWYVQSLLRWGFINVGLFVFNLLPLPPLDGSHLYMPFLKTRNERLFMAIHKYGSLALIMLVVAENRFGFSVFPIDEAIERLSLGALEAFGFFR
jgi:Zn-dependent protease